MKQTQHIPNRPFKTWSKQEHQTWKLLAERQMKNLEGKVSQTFWTGVEKLQIPVDHIPKGEELQEKLAEHDWNLVSTNLEFADGQSWFSALNRNEFFMTEYIRPLDSLDYTPKPDAFHDMFGHLPYIVDPQLKRIIHLFTKLIITSHDEDRKRLGHIWWYTIEFGLVKENDGIKAFGAGLTSSFGELNAVFSDPTVVKPFDIEVIGQTSESPTKFHNQYFVLESFDQLEEVLGNWR